mgnify:CR=1 FL=1
MTNSADQRSIKGFVYSFDDGKSGSCSSTTGIDDSTSATTETGETDSDETDTPPSERVTEAGAHLRPSGDDGWTTLIRRGRGGRP